MLALTHDEWWDLAISASGWLGSSIREQFTDKQLGVIEALCKDAEENVQAAHSGGDAMTFDVEAWVAHNAPHELGVDAFRMRMAHKLVEAAQAAQCEADATWLGNQAAGWRKASVGEERLDGKDVAMVLEGYATAIRAAKEK